MSEQGADVAAEEAAGVACQQARQGCRPPDAYPIYGDRLIRPSKLAVPPCLCSKIDNDRARLHHAERLAIDQQWRRAAGDLSCRDDELHRRQVGGETSAESRLFIA